MSAEEIPVIPANDEQQEVVKQPEREQTVGSMNPQDFADLLAETILEAQRKVEGPQFTEEFKNTPVNNVLHTTGNVCHGIIDIGEGLMRGVVDVATLGRSKRF